MISSIEISLIWKKEKHLKNLNSNGITYNILFMTTINSRLSANTNLMTSL